MLNTLAECCKGLGLSISCKKTKTMAVLPDHSPRPEPVHLFPNEAPVEVVSHFQYLGSIVQDDCSSALEVDSRICKASKAFQSLSRILWYQRKIKSRTKLRILNAVILPTLLYGLESTVLHEHQIQRLQSFVMRCLRIILGVSVRDMKRNTTIRQMAKQQRLSSVLMQRRLRLLGHLSRMDDSRLPKQLLVCAPVSGSRAVGGQKYRWNDLVSKDLAKCGMSSDWRERAQSRDAWRWETKRNVEVVNAEAEQEEKKRKDRRKRLREQRQADAEAGLHCNHPGCSFVAVNKAGLTNHQRQKHTLSQVAVCAFCAQSFAQQGLYNHQRFCRSRPRAS